MRETKFIKENQEKWREFEQILNGKTASPDKLSDLFIQITDDLSHARTFYPHRSVRVYLNGLAQRIFLKFIKAKKHQLAVCGHSGVMNYHKLSWSQELLFDFLFLFLHCRLLSECFHVRWTPNLPALS